MNLISVSHAGTLNLDSDHAFLFALAATEFRGRFTIGFSHYADLTGTCVLNLPQFTLLFYLDFHFFIEA